MSEILAQPHLYSVIQLSSSFILALLCSDKSQDRKKSKKERKQCQFHHEEQFIYYLSSCSKDAFLVNITNLWVHTFSQILAR